MNLFRGHTFISSNEWSSSTTVLQLFYRVHCPKQFPLLKHNISNKYWWWFRSTFISLESVFAVLLVADVKILVLWYCGIFGTVVFNVLELLLECYLVQK